MKETAPVSDDFFVGRKRRFARGGDRARGAHLLTPPKSASRHELDRAEQLHEEQSERIRLTIANRSLETHFQPIVDLRSGKAIGTEALSRFAQQPVRPPDAWFAEAAEIGLGVELELTALEMALGQLHYLPNGLYLSLNASVETMLSPDFRAILTSCPSERIVLELTEHTPVTDYAAFADSIGVLRSHGVRLAVDDAGSGFSSFSHVLNLKPDIIKLDIALTRGIDKDPARQSLGRALLAFGLESYRTTIVAEGIETKAELETLRSLGCPGGQGYLLGRPGRLYPPLRPPVATGPLPPTG
jgi:EAL domain-containing protein (putative c-di-GMP-specific phosphodiesterase class I)